MTPEFILAMAGIAVSLIFMYLPNLNEKYAALGGQAKRLIMLGIITLVTAGIGVLDHFEFIDIGVDFTTKAGLVQFATAYILALLSNQGTYLISPVPEAVERAKTDSFLDRLTPEGTRSIEFETMEQALDFLSGLIEEDPAESQD